MGWASGFRAGSDIAQRIIDGREKRQLKEGLSRAADQYRVTEGEYGPQLGENVAQVQGLKQQAIQGGMTPEMAGQQYDQSIAELQRRQGLTAPDFSVGSRGKNYGTRQEASAVAQPQVMQAQAQTYESMGQPDKAADMRANALNMENSRVGLEANKIKLTVAQRGEREQSNLDTYNSAVAQLQPSDRTPDRLLAIANSYELTSGQQDTLIANLAGRNEAEIKIARQQITKLTQGKSLDQLSELHKSNELLDPGRHFEVLRDKDGNVSLQMVDSKTGNPIGGPAFRGTEAEATRYLNLAASSPEALVDYATNLAKIKSDMAKNDAATRASDASTSQSNANVALIAANTDKTRAETRALSNGTKEDQAKAADYRKALSSAIADVMKDERFSRLPAGEQDKIIAATTARINAVYAIAPDAALGSNQPGFDPYANPGRGGTDKPGPPVYVAPAAGGGLGLTAGQAATATTEMAATAAQRDQARAQNAQRKAEVQQLSPQVINTLTLEQVRAVQAGGYLQLLNPEQLDAVRARESQLYNAEQDRLYREGYGLQ